jgi:hypothetical protein
MTLLRDPAAWAADAHRLYYLPAATNYAKLITHPRFAAKTGLARTLERWCLERPELASRLKTQPQVWLQAFEEAKSDLMWQARKAMAYVACCVDAPDHHAMQCACDDRGGKDLSFGLQACAAVTEHICLTPEGTALARRMAFCQELLPARHIFYEDKAPPNKRWYPAPTSFEAWPRSPASTRRYSWSAVERASSFPSSSADVAGVALAPAPPVQYPPNSRWYDSCRKRSRASSSSDLGGRRAGATPPEGRTPRSGSRARPRPRAMVVRCGCQASCRSPGCGGRGHARSIQGDARRVRW